MGRAMLWISENWVPVVLISELLVYLVVVTDMPLPEPADEAPISATWLLHPVST
tara:strand:- start:1909 stop:2070 length:162 start_codon:yes stop_codon:yes gene_type:complete